MRNEVAVMLFRHAGYKQVSELVKASKSRRSSKNLSIGCFFRDGYELCLVSYGKTIAVRRRCKLEDCVSCDNRFRCEKERLTVISEGNVIQEETDTCRVRYITTHHNVPTQLLGNAIQAKTIQRHIKLVEKWLKPDPESDKEHIDELNEGGLFPHPSTVFPIVETVNCWADEVKY